MVSEFVISTFSSVLTEVWYLDLVLDMVTGLGYTQDIEFEGTKNIHVLEVLI